MSRAKSICDRVYAVGGSELSAPEDAYVYLVDAGSELVMIDAGVGYGMKRIEENIRSMGWQPAQVWHIIATHCHIDHIGGLYAWKEQYGPKIIAHELDRAGIEGENDQLTAAGMYGVAYKPVKVDHCSRARRRPCASATWIFTLFILPATLRAASASTSIPRMAGSYSARTSTGHSPTPGALIWGSGGDP